MIYADAMTKLIGEAVVVWLREVVEMKKDICREKMGCDSLSG